MLHQRHCLPARQLSISRGARHLLGVSTGVYGVAFCSAVCPLKRGTPAPLPVACLPAMPLQSESPQLHCAAANVPGDMPAFKPCRSESRAHLLKPSSAPTTRLPLEAPLGAASTFAAPTLLWASSSSQCRAPRGGEEGGRETRSGAIGGGKQWQPACGPETRCKGSRRPEERAESTCFASGLFPRPPLRRGGDSGGTPASAKGW